MHEYGHFVEHLVLFINNFHRGRVVERRNHISNEDTSLTERKKLNCCRKCFQKSSLFDGFECRTLGVQSARFWKTTEIQRVYFVWGLGKIPILTRNIFKFTLVKRLNGQKHHLL